MVKHIITTECQRSCSYCISKKINIEQVDLTYELPKLQKIYETLSSQHESIMLTGGEPSQAYLFHVYVKLARQYFKKVFITTQDEYLLGWTGSKHYFDAITFSWHDLKTWRYAVTNDAVVYASILSHLYSDWLIKTVKELGYSGLTINENHFTTDVFDESQLIAKSYKARKEYIDGHIILKLNDDPFTIKINRRGQCFNNDTVYIMPDLSIRESFEEYL